MAELTDAMIDAPLIELVNNFNKLPYCFTMQSCYGHFLYNGQEDKNNLDPLPIMDTIASVEYRIAYIVFCIDHVEPGRSLFNNLMEITSIDPENIQFCCAEWFWKRQINSYALQVEPERFKSKDWAILDYKEALKIEEIRNEFYTRLKGLLKEQL
ncbi:MAG TPA: hypothetical protein VJ373_08430 [Desulfatiglandales bacterium]|nr:hypothetical protein [Desulfatiglandales bacterium]